MIDPARFPTDRRKWLCLALIIGLAALSCWLAASAADAESAIATRTGPRPSGAAADLASGRSERSAFRIDRSWEVSSASWREDGEAVNEEEDAPDEDDDATRTATAALGGLDFGVGR